MIQKRSLIYKVTYHKSLLVSFWFGLIYQKLTYVKLTRNVIYKERVCG